jgi:hypothetical protein
LNFLLASGRSWDAASEEDAEYFKEWRLSEQSNPRRVAGSTFAVNLLVTWNLTVEIMISRLPDHELRRSIERHRGAEQEVAGTCPA